jgi:ligand-binding SRPBCC domain-containing protein
MKIYHLHKTHFLPISIAEAWDFFSSPKNLGKITPAKMNFKITSISGGDKTYAGQIIKYKVTVLPLMRLTWVTEITHVKEPELFVDEQLSGPYALWHHQHHFKSVEGGVEMTDDLNYALPLGVLGQLANAVLVGRQVSAIFDYRTKVLNELFPVSPKV